MTSPHRLAYLIGEPGIGKTTAMAALTEGFQPVPLDPIRGAAPARIAFLDTRGGGNEPAAVELGRRRDGGFSGTDALPMAIIGDACTYLESGQAASEAPRLLVEGARLANRRFLATATAAGWDVHLLLMHGEQAAAEHRAARGSQQDPGWIKGRRSAAQGLAVAATAVGATAHYVEVTPERSAAQVAELVAEALADVLT